MAEPRLELLGKITWRQDVPWFGGFSGIEMSDDGGGATLLTDRGSLVRVGLQREGGRLRAVQLLSRTPLRDARGIALTGESTDAEGLAKAEDGTLFISFEAQHRVVSLAPSGLHEDIGPVHPDFAGFKVNSGLEALALHPDGRLFTLPERSGARNRPFPLYAHDGTGWTIVGRIPRRGPFLPVGADFDATGQFYLLERAATPLGFRSRIRRFQLDTGRAETLLRTGPGRYDNLEGISVWQDAAGRTMLTLISDDNFLSIQRTQIVEFVLTE